MKLITGNAHRRLAEDLAQELRVPLEPAEVASFADGETRVHIPGDLRGEAVFVVQSTGPPVNDHLMELALLVDAARAAGARQVVGLVPYLGYARQEQRGAVGDPRSAQVVAKLLRSVELDHLVTLDLHAPALESAFEMPVTLLSAEDVFVPHLTSWVTRDFSVVAPDAGGVKRAQRFATALACRLAVIAKQRPKPDIVATREVLGDVANRVCVVVDDMASTGRTLVAAAQALRAAGAVEMHAVFTHPVMAPGALERIASAGFRRLLTTDTIPASDDPRLEVIRIAPLLARTVRYLCGEPTDTRIGSA